MAGDEKPNERTDSEARLTIHVCRDGHAFLHACSECPVCGRVASKTEICPRARLVALTTVRVTPSGGPFRLGLAETSGGAKTLCIVDNDVGGDDGDVTLYVEGGLYHAKPRD